MCQIVQHVAYPLLDDDDDENKNNNDPDRDWDQIPLETPSDDDETTPDNTDATPSPSQMEAKENTKANTLALQTLANLCLTSRPLREITLPFLYQELSLGYGDVKGEHFSPPRAGQRLASFLRTVIRNREIARFVKRAFLHPKIVEGMGDDERDSVARLAREFLRSGDGSMKGERKPYGEVFRDQRFEVVVLALMPRLERIVFAGYGYVPIPGEVMRSGVWERLKTVEIVTEYGWSFSELVMIREYDRDMVGCYYDIPWEGGDDDL